MGRWGRVGVGAGKEMGVVGWLVGCVVGDALLSFVLSRDAYGRRLIETRARVPWRRVDVGRCVSIVGEIGRTGPLTPFCCSPDWSLGRLVRR